MKLSSNLLKIGIGGAALLGCSLSLLYYAQNKILYLPVIPGTSRSPSQNIQGSQSPSEQGMFYTDVEIQTKDKIKLRGWLIKQQQNSNIIPTVIFFHENAGNIGHRLTYRGFSDSDGTPSEEGIQKDSEAILDYIFKKDDINKELIFTHGRSLGGAVSAYALSHTQYPIKGAILENTFTSIIDMASSMLPVLSYFLKIPGLQRNKWDTKTNLQNIKAPLLFIKSTEDEIVPHYQMLELIETAKKYTKVDVYSIEGGTHNENWQQDLDNYFKRISQFIYGTVNSNTPGQL